MEEINEIRFSGTIERLQSVNTRTGNPMSSWLLKVGRDRFKCVCFGNLADTVLQCQDGDQISLTGTGSINSWKDNDGHWHNDFQVSVWAAEIGGQQICYEKQDQPPAARSLQPDPHGLNEYDVLEDTPF